jgi:D-2-hydroxyacid dehydrogenase (NADP+)
MAHPVLVIDWLAEVFRDRIKAEFPELEVLTARRPAEAGGAFAAAGAVMSFGTGLTDEMFQSARQLEWLQFLSSGTDAVLRLPSLGTQVAVTSTHGVHGPPVSEMAFLHMMVLARNYRGILANQQAARWQKVNQPLLNGKTVVILGVGLIAAQLAPRCQGFGMTVIGVSGTPREAAGFDRILPRTALADAAALADFLVLLIPYSQATHHIVDARIFAAMKPTAILVNLARGDVCDEDAMLAALAEKRIAGAGLDVFRTEPLPPEHPLWRMENVLVTPHIGGNNDLYPDLVMPILRVNLRCYVERRFSDMVNRRPR